ncbi:hypothetical protein LIER_27797 [Lithospermum erythrorhizon]|uniref:Uncharacterized protein n=1 Tax=Lithospermum erythrorhizon TaxID=34254 RepID=A0AAV3RDM9_LITER
MLTPISTNFLLLTSLPSPSLSRWCRYHQISSFCWNITNSTCTLFLSRAPPSNPNALKVTYEDFNHRSVPPLNAQRRGGYHLNFFQGCGTTSFTSTPILELNKNKTQSKSGAIEKNAKSSLLHHQRTNRVFSNNFKSLKIGILISAYSL